jgi:hypothetical protein
MPKSRSARPGASGAPFEALAAFARGYLHQDVIPVHGSAVGAMLAFCQDANASERQALHGDLTRLLAMAAAWPPTTLARLFGRELGASWLPASIDDVRALERALAPHIQ